MTLTRPGGTRRRGYFKTFKIKSLGAKLYPSIEDKTTLERVNLHATVGWLSHGIFRSLLEATRYV